MGLEKNRGRADQLQFLRFLAFLNIYIYHTDHWLFFKYPSSHCAFSAVSFFFILSGVVTGYSYYGREIKLGVREYGTYMWKKLCKFYPLYFCTVIFTVLSSNIPELIAAYRFTELQQFLKSLLRSVLLLQSWFQEGYYQFNGVGWFLSNMMFLYLLNLPVMVLLNKLGEKRYWYILFPALIFVVAVEIVVYCYLTQAYDMEYWHYIFPPARVGEYLIGMLMGVFLCKIKPMLDNVKYNRVIFTAFEIIVLLYWIRSLSSPGNYWRNHIVSWLIPNVALLSVFTVGAGAFSKLFRCAPLLKIGNATYECYIIHQIVIQQYLLFHNSAGTTQSGKVVSFVMCLLVSILFAILLHGRDQKAMKIEVYQ